MPNVQNPQEIIKPVHVYKIPEASLNPYFRHTMDQISYSTYAMHPDRLPENPARIRVTENMEKTAENLMHLHYVILFERLSLDHNDNGLNDLIRGSSSFEAVKNAYEADPGRYYRGPHPEKIAEHLPEIYDAVTRDMECREAGLAAVKQMLENYTLPELEQDNVRDLGRNPLLRNNDEIRQAEFRRDIARKTAADDILERISSEQNGPNRWANRLLEKPLMKKQDQEAIRSLNDGNPQHTIELARRYLEELKNMKGKELDKYDWREYHGPQRAQHAFNGRLAHDTTMMLSALENAGVPVDRKTKDIILRYTDALSANFSRAGHEDHLLLNPYGKYMKLENIRTAEEALSLFPKNNTIWKNGVQEGALALADNQEQQAKNAALSAADRKAFDAALDHLIDTVIRTQALAAEKPEAEKNAAESSAIRKPEAAASVIIKKKQPQNAPVYAGRTINAYLQHAENVMSDDPAVLQKYEEFEKTMQALTAEIGKLNTPGKDRKLPIVGSENIQKLKQLYSDATFTGADLLSISAAKGRKQEAAFRDSIRNVLNLLQKDSSILERFDPKRKLTFPQMLHAVHSEFIDAGKMKIETRSGQMSQRMAMSVRVQDSDGTQRYAKGLFTAEEHRDLNQFVADALKKHHINEQPPRTGRTEAEKAVETAYNELLKICRNKPGQVAELMDLLEKDKDEDTFYHWNKNYEDDIPKAVENWKSKYVDDVSVSGFKELFEAFRADCADAWSKDYTMSEAGIPNGARLDQRNSAMSAVAELLGRSDLICKSTPMLIRKDGKLTKGTFMEFSELSDSKETPEDFEGISDYGFMPGFVKDAADLQIIDFICGNIDRHGRNMFYKIEKGKVTGLQGIDNDLCFGIIRDEVLNGDEFITNFKGLKNMRIIHKEMADKLAGITPEILKAVLSPYGLSSAETDAACHRLEMVKNAIDRTYVSSTDKENATAFRNRKAQLNRHEVERMFDQDRLYVLDQKLIEKTAEGNMIGMLTEKIDRNGKEKPANHFTHAMQTVRDARDTMERRKAFDEKVVPKEKTPLPEAALAERTSTFNAGELADTLQKHIQELEKQNRGAFISSQEYRNVLDYAKIVQKQMNLLRDDPDPENVQSHASTLLESLHYLNQIYMDKKDNDGSLLSSSTAAGRYQTVRSFQDTIEQCMDQINLPRHREFARLSAIQRAGAFRQKQDTAQIAAAIKRINASEHTLQAAEFNVRSIFSAVTERAYSQTFEEYRDMIEDITAPDENSVFADTPDSPDHELLTQIHAVQNTLKNPSKDSSGMETVQSSLLDLRSRITGTNGYLDKIYSSGNPAGSAEKILSACELARLADRAERNSASPKREYQQRIAERLTRIHFRMHPDQLQQRESYENVCRKYAKNPVLTVMTAGKTLKQMQKYVEASEDTLQKLWNRACTRAEKLQAAQPQMQNPQLIA